MKVSDILPYYDGQEKNLTKSQKDHIVEFPIYGHLWAKAVLYYFNGPDWYKKKDLLHYPKKSWPRTSLKNIAGQISESFGGISSENPISVGTMRDFFNAMKLFHFEVFSFEVLNGTSIIKASMEHIFEHETLSLYFCLASREPILK
jgi:hypothetical protein